LKLTMQIQFDEHAVSRALLEAIQASPAMRVTRLPAEKVRPPLKLDSELPEIPRQSADQLIPGSDFNFHLMP